MISYLAGNTETFVQNVSQNVNIKAQSDLFKAFYPNDPQYCQHWLSNSDSHILTG